MQLAATSSRSSGLRAVFVLQTRMVVRRPLVVFGFAAWIIALVAFVVAGSLRDGIPFLMVMLLVLSPVPFAGVWMGVQEAVLREWVLGTRVTPSTMFAGSVLARLSPSIAGAGLITVSTVLVAPAGHLDIAALPRFVGSILCLCAWATVLSTAVRGWANLGLLFFMELGAIAAHGHLTQSGEIGTTSAALISLAAPFLSATVPGQWLHVAIPFASAAILFAIAWARVQWSRV